MPTISQFSPQQVANLCLVIIDEANQPNQESHIMKGYLRGLFRTIGNGPNYLGAGGISKATVLSALESGIESGNILQVLASLGNLLAP